MRRRQDKRIVPVHVVPKPNSTTLQFSAGEAEKIIDMLRVGSDLDFGLFDKTERIARLPLHNDASFPVNYSEMCG